MTTPAVLAKLRSEVGDLLAKHATTRSLSDFAAYADDPVGFMLNVLHCEPWSRQVEFAELVRDNPRTCVISANSIGKDWLVARLALWWVYARHGLVIFTSVTERQVKHILMREVRRAFTSAPELPGELFQLELRVNDECGILAFTSDRSDRLVGFHHPRLMVCLSEGQGIEETVYEAAHACCTAPGNRLVAYGNPVAAVGAFYRAATSDQWAMLRIPATDHPNIVTGRPEIPGAVSVEWVEMMREEYGANSPIYRARVLAEFSEDSLDGLISRAWMRAAFERFEAGALADEWAPVILGLDVARFGPDATVLAVVRGPVVEALHTWHGASTTDTAEKTITHAERLSWQHRRGGIIRPTIVVDGVGVGAGVVDELRRRKWTAIEFNGGNKPINERKFLNMRAEVHWTFRTLLERGRVALPRDEALLEEGLALEYQLTSKGLIQLLGKDEIRKTLGRSPDKVDAVVMALAHGVGRVRHTATTQTVLM